LGEIISARDRKSKGRRALSLGLKFSTAMDPLSVTNTNNYQLEWVSKKRVKRNLETVLHPVAIESATYEPSIDAVVLVTGTTSSTFAKGGQLRVISSPPGGVDSTAGDFLGGRTVLTIYPKASRIVP
jgi:hypothetical protein